MQQHKNLNNMSEEVYEPKLVINVRDEEGNIMDDIDVAIYEKESREVLLKEMTGENGQVSMPLNIRKPMKVEIRCRRRIVNGVRYNPFSEMHTVFPGGFELNVTMQKDFFFNP